MAIVHTLLAGCTLASLLLAVVVVARLARTAGGARVRRGDVASAARIAVIVPVLNERGRLSRCLDGLAQQPCEVAEILVVDGGSTDGTAELVAAYAARDARIRWIDASPIPPHWTGKAWGLDYGLKASAETSEFVLCVDADVRPTAPLARSLLAHAARTGVSVLSIAVRQQLHGVAAGLLHPAMLTTLVYRAGIPGRVSRTPQEVQANGQCFLARRDLLQRSGAFRAARASLCEDITSARCLARAGYAVGFYESDDLVQATMYAGWRETWRNWPRSLPMRDQYFGWHGALGLAEVLFVQALPLPLLLLACLTAAPTWIVAANAALLCIRVGVLAGMARAYVARPWTYWLSPLLDVPVAYALQRSAMRHRHAWRGRTYRRVAPGRFELVLEA
jgi:dolichol-phosphate mannosyltransferase